VIREGLEPFVDAAKAADFLSLTRRRVLDLARSGHLPGHPIGSGARRTWRFRLTELSNAVASAQKNRFASPQKASIVRGPVVPGRLRK